MSSQFRLYRARPEEGFCAPVYSREDEGLIRKISDRTSSTDASDEPWSPQSLILHRETKSDAIPHLSSFPIRYTCSQEAAVKLWPSGTNDFELLPIQVEGDPWHFIRCLRLVEALDVESSDISWNGYEDEGKPVKWVSDIYWVNVTDLNACQYDAFRLAIQPRGIEFFTEKFVERCGALNLRGLRFEHVGYIVDKPENAVPPPPRPIPEVPQAPRWPKWEAAPDEEVARFTQAGQAFLQARGLSESAEASAILNALAADIEAHRPGYAKLKPKARIEVLEGLAGAFCLLLRQQLQWNWVDLQVTSRAWDLGMESPNGSHALCLNQVMVRQLTSREPSTITLLFNMISVGNLPPGDPGDHVAIG